MKIEHVRVSGIYKIIADVKDDKNKAILPEGHIVRVQTVLKAMDAVMVEDLTEDTDAYVFVEVAGMDYVTLADLYGELAPKEEPKHNKDSPSYNSHYINMIGLQPIEVMQEVLSHDEFIGFLKGNIIKYSMRAGHKEGESVEKDVAKAKQYKEWLADAKVYYPIKLDKGGESNNGTSKIQEACCGRCNS